MAKAFNSIEELVGHVNHMDVPEETVSAVEEEVKRILLKHIKEDIYDNDARSDTGWHGGKYPRRHVLENNIVSYRDGNTIIVTSEASAGQSPVKGQTFSNKDSGFLRLLESGHMGFWKKGFPRPAVPNAQDEVDNSPVIKALLGR